MFIEKFLIFILQGSNSHCVGGFSCWQARCSQKLCEGWFAFNISQYFEVVNDNLKQDFNFPIWYETITENVIWSEIFFLHELKFKVSQKVSTSSDGFFGFFLWERLNTYLVLQYVFSPEPIPKGTKGAQTVHEELAKNLTTILRPANADNVVVCKFLKYSWFFFEILIKSMALYLISTDRIKVSTFSYMHI